MFVPIVFGIISLKKIFLQNIVIDVVHHINVHKLCARSQVGGCDLNKQKCTKYNYFTGNILIENPVY